MDNIRQQFEHLYDNKIIYFENGVTQIVKIKQFINSLCGFRIYAVSDLLIKSDIRLRMQKLVIKNNFDFGCRWDELHIFDNCLTCDYSCWRIWINPALVKKVEQLTINKNYKEALALTLYAEKDIHCLYDKVEKITLDEINGFYTP